MMQIVDRRIRKKGALRLDSLIFWGYEFLAAFIPLTIVLTLTSRLRKREEALISRSTLLPIIVFSLYILGVFHFTGAGTLADGLTYPFETQQRQLNFVPFSNDIDIAAYLLNILMLIPFGILVPLVWKKMDRFLCTSFAGFAFSLLIETSQLLNNRRSDIDDLILNTAGAIIGFALYRAWNRCTKSKYQLRSSPAIGMTVCVLSLFIGRFLLFNEMGLAKLLYHF